MAGGSEEKTLPPSAKKLREARRKGQVPKSKDFVSALVTLAAFGFVISQFPQVAARFIGLLGQAGAVADQDVATTRAELVSAAIQLFALAVIPLLLLLVLIAIGSSVIAAGGPVFALDPIIPKLTRLNPAEGIKKIVSARGFIEVGKSLLKLVMLVTLAVTTIRGSLQAMVELPSCGLRCAGPILRGTMLPLVSAGVLLFLVVGAADLLLQRWLFRRDQRMSFTERKNEHKNTEGNPLIKGAHKRERRESAKLKSGLREATFVVTGRRVAVAMRYSTSDTRVPMPVARAGYDDVVMCVQVARKLKLPTIHDHEAARALFDKVAIGHTIPRDLFNPVIGCMKRLGIL